MKLIFSIAAAAVALSASPALADDRGGHGHGHGDSEWNDRGEHGDRQDGRDWNGRGEHRHGQDGREWNDRGEQRNNGYDRSSYGNCPPGLARKHNGCTPPGQYRHARWSRGQRLPRGYSGYTAYNQIPYSYRNQYNLDPNNRYIYQDNTVYQVNPRTQIIQQILGGLVR